MYIVIGIFGVLFLIFLFAFGKMVKDSIKYFWYEYYEDEEDIEKEK